MGYPQREMGHLQREMGHYPGRNGEKTDQIAINLVCTIPWA